MLDFVHYMVFNIFPLIGVLIFIIGIFYFFFVYFSPERSKSITLGVSCVAFGYWLKHIHYFKVHQANHGFLSNITHSFLVTLITTPQNHWVLFGIIPALAIIVFTVFSIKENAADVYLLSAIAILSVVCLAIGLSWILIYYSQYPSFLSDNALFYS